MPSRKSDSDTPKALTRYEKTSAALRKIASRGQRKRNLSFFADLKKFSDRITQPAEGQATPPQAPFTPKPAYKLTSLIQKTPPDLSSVDVLKKNKKHAAVLLCSQTEREPGFYIATEKDSQGEIVAVGQSVIQYIPLVPHTKAQRPSLSLSLNENKNDIRTKLSLIRLPNILHNRIVRDQGKQQYSPLEYSPKPAPENPKS